MEIKRSLALCVVVLLVFSTIGVSFAASAGEESYEIIKSEEKTSPEYSSRIDTEPTEDHARDHTTKSPFRIDGDEEFADKAESEEWDGNGTEENPYIISGYDIDAEGQFGAGIFIGNTTVHFIIEECIIKRSTSISSPYHPGGGIVYHNVENGTLRDVEIHTSNYGLYLDGIEDNHFESITINSIREDGVLLVDSDNNTFEGGKIYTTSENGFRFEGDCKSNNLVDMTITNNAGSGLYLDGNLEANEFVDLTIGGNTEHGIYIGGSFEDNQIEGCRITSNGLDGILFDSSEMSGNEIKDNRIYNNGRDGIRVGVGPEYNYILNNTIEENEGYQIYFATRESLANHFDNNELNGVEYVHYFAQENETVTVEEYYDFESYQTLTNYGGVVIYESENISLEKMNIRTLDSRGVTVLSSEHVTLDDFVITNVTEEGILIEDSEHIYLDEFVITNVAEEGILAEDSKQVYLEDIEVSDSLEGISIDAFEHIYLTDVSVKDSEGLGISITASEHVDLTNIWVENSEDTAISIEALENIELNDISIKDAGSTGISIGPSGFFETLNELSLHTVDIENSEGPGIHIEDSEIIQMVDLEIINNMEGISIDGSRDIEIADVEVTRSEGSGIWIEDSEWVELSYFEVADCSGPGIYMEGLNGVKLEEGYIINNERGVELVNSNSGEFERIRAHENEIGIHLEGVSNIIVLDSDMTSNQEGIRFSDSEMNEIIGSDIIANREHGIHLTGDSSINTIRENYISNNQDGIHLTEGANSCTVEDNVVSNNMRYGIYASTNTNSISNNNISQNLDYGIYMTGASSSVFNNRFMFNNGSNLTYNSSTVQAFDDGNSNTWYDLNEYGNYWWDWMDKYDEAQDDFDDAKVIHEPYIIDGDAGSEDLYPLYADIDDYETYELTIEVEKEGSTHPKEGTITYFEGERVTVEAMPAHGYVFSEWTGDIEDEDTIITFVMDEDKEITANFERDEFKLTVEVVGEGTTHPEEGTHTYLYEDEVNVTAYPDTGWHISNWAGDIEEGEEEEITVTMDEDKHVIVIFERNHYNLTIDVVGEGTTQPEEGTHTYLYEDEVNVTAEADHGWIFSNWTGDIEGEEEEITVVMKEDKHVVANFERDDFNLTIQIEGEGATDPKEGTYTYTYEDEVHVTAYPAPGWYIHNWTGDYEGVDEEITIEMDDDKVITANFKVIDGPTLRIEEGEGNGNVKIDGMEVDLPYERRFPHGVEAELEPVSDHGWSFSNWTGDLYEHALEFDGDGDVINCGDHETLKFDDDSMSISTWVKPNDTEENMGIAGKLHYDYDFNFIGDDDHFYHGYALSMNNNRFQFQIGDGTNQGSERIISQDTFEENDEWYHVVGVHDGYNFYLYVNGQLQGEFEDHQIADFDDDFVIGRRYSPNSDVGLGEVGGPYWWDGEINDVRVYGRALSEDDIADLYGSDYEPIGGEVGWWAMNEGIGNIAYDQSTNENHGDIIGARWTNYPIESIPDEVITLVMNQNRTIKANFVEDEMRQLHLEKEGEGQIYVDGELVEVPYTREYDEGAEVDLEADAADGWCFGNWTGDIYEYSLEFDGSGDVVNCGDHGSLKFDNEAMSISARVKPNNLEQEMGIAGSFYYELDEPILPIFPDEHLYYGYSLSLNEGRFQFNIGDGTDEGYEVVESDEVYEESKWYHVTGVHDGNNFYLYVNGELQGTLEDHEIADHPDDFVIGRQYSPDSDIDSPLWWDGKISDVRVYDRGLSEIDIEILYENIYEEIGGEVGWWSMSEGTGDTVYDQSDNENHGEIRGAEWVEYFIGSSPYESISVVMDEDKSITANFVEVNELSLDIGEGEGDIYVDGTLVEVPYSEEHMIGTEVEIEASPADHWRFTNWTGDYESTEEIITVVMDEDKSIKANFEEIEYRYLTIEREGEGYTVPSVGTHQYVYGDEVRVRANPNTGWVFDQWTGDVPPGQGEYRELLIVMDEDKEITVHFERATYELDIDIEGNGSVEIEPDKDEYEYGEEVNLTAVPDENYEFTEWAGDYESSEEEITITMDANKRLIAYFDRIEHELEIDVIGEGTTDPEPGTHTYEDGEEVNVTATPDDGWEFIEWTGDHEGTEEEITITMDQDYEITAVFEEKVEYYELELDIKGEGTTDPEPGVHTYEPGEEVTIEAVPEEGWKFVRWSGDNLTVEDVTADQTTIEMLDNYDITAEFEEIIDHLQVTTLDAKNVTHDSVVLQGELIGVEEEVKVYFRYREEGAENWIDTVNQTLDEDSIFEDILLGLDSDTTYEFKAVVESDDEMETGDILSFKTELKFIPSSLRIEPDEIDIGEDITLLVNVTNIGDISGDYTLEFYVNGEYVDSDTVTVEGGETETASVYYTIEDTGSYEIKVNGLTLNIEVEEEEDLGYWLTLMIIVLIIVLIAVIAMTGMGKNKDKTPKKKVFRKKKEDNDEEDDDENDGENESEEDSENDDEDDDSEDESEEDSENDDEDDDSEDESEEDW